MDAPFIAVFGPSKSTVCEIKLVIEKENIIDMPNSRTAVNCCMAAYYVFNITYPNGISCLMNLLETFLYQIRCSKKLPVSAVTVIDNLKRM